MDEDAASPSGKRKGAGEGEAKMAKGDAKKAKKAGEEKRKLVDLEVTVPTYTTSSLMLCPLLGVRVCVRSLGFIL